MAEELMPRLVMGSAFSTMPHIQAFLVAAGSCLAHHRESAVPFGQPDSPMLSSLRG
jgi:hypothetical protein